MPPGKVSDQNGFSAIFIIIGVSTVILLFSVWYVMTKSPVSNTDAPNTTVTPQPSLNPSSQGFKKKLFPDSKIITQDDKFEKDGYPPALVNFNDDDLVGIKCTPIYSDNAYGPANPDFYLDGAKESQDVLTDQQKKELVSHINLGDSHLSDAQFCKTEDNKLIWSYNLDYLTPKQTTYFEISNPNENTNTNITKIAGDKYGWFYCTKPLMLTKSGIFYYQCIGGDNNIADPIVKQFIYAIDLNNKSYQLVALK